MCLSLDTLLTLICGAHLVKFEFKWGFQGWFQGGWVGCWVAALPPLRVLVCAGISLHQSRSNRQLVYASCPWVIDGRGLVLVPLSFLVLVVRSSAVGLDALGLTWNVSNVVVFG